MDEIKQDGEIQEEAAGADSPEEAEPAEEVGEPKEGRGGSND